MAGKLASLLIKISANGAEAEKELRSLEKKMTNIAKNFEKVGKTMTKYITAPLTAIAGITVAAANTQLQAEAKLLNSLRGREDVQQRLIAQASEVQSRSLFGDEAIIEQQAFLAALGLSEKQINDTIEAAAQLSAVLGIELSSAVQQLEKTYSGSAGRLAQMIPELKGLTEEELKSGAAVKYINENFKGFAETAAEVGTGPLVQFKNALGDLAEQFGTILLPAVQKTANWLKDLTAKLQAISPQTKKTILVIGTIVAAIGPLLFTVSKLIVSIKILTLAMPALKAGLLSLVNPVTAAVTAVLVLATAWANARSEHQRYLDSINGANEALANKVYQRFYDEYSRPVYSDADLEKKLVEVKENNKAQIELYERLARGSTEEHALQYKGMANDLRQEAKAIEDVIAARKRAAEDAAALAKQNQIDAPKDLKDQTGIINKLTAEIKSLEEAKQTAENEADIKRINRELEYTKRKLEEIKSLGSDVGPIAVNLSEKAAEKLKLSTSDELLTLEPKDVGETTLAADKMSADWEYFAKRAESVQKLINSIAEAMKKALSNLATSIGEGIGDFLAGEEVDPIKRFMEVLGNALKTVGAALVAYAVAMTEFKEAMRTVFMNPWGAIALGTAAIALGQLFINKAQEPIKLAKGGLAYGPTLAVVGDNMGAASDPEVIAPLSKLRNYMGGQQLELVGDVAFELRGDVARAILNKENIRLNRKG